MQETENTYILLAHRVQHAIDIDDILDLQECAELIEFKRMYFVETDEESHRKVVKPITVYAAENGSITVMRFLLEENCDINAQDSYGNTPLMAAVECNRLEMIRFLIKQSGVCLEMKNYYGETVGSIASLNRDQVVIRYLKELKKPLLFDAVSFRLSSMSSGEDATRH